MKKILFLICVLFGIGINDGLAQTVDVYFNQPVPYHEIPVKHVKSSYKASANYIWTDGVSFTTDTLNVTLGGNTFGEDSISEANDFAGATVFPDTIFNEIIQDDATGSYVDATFTLDFGTNDLTLDGTWENGNFTSTVTALASAVDVTSNSYARADDAALTEEVGPGTYGSVGNQFELMVDDNISEIVINFGASTAANTEYNVTVYSTTSGTVSTGTVIYTSPIQQVSAAGAQETLNVDLELTAGWYVIMVNQITTTTFTLDAEDVNDDGQVIFFNVDGEFDRQDRGDVDIAITTEAPTIPEFTKRVPGDEIVWVVGEAGSYTFTAEDEDGDTPIFNLYDTLPSFNVDWLTFTDNGDGTATLSGTPSVSNIGTIELYISVKDDVNATDSTTYSGQYADLTLRVVNSVEFDIPFSEDFNDVVAGQIPANWELNRDVDGNGDGSELSWRENLNEMFIDEDAGNTKQNEWLITPPINLPTVSGSEDYLLSFYLDFKGQEGNFVGGNPSVLGSGADGDGNFADITVWVLEADDTMTEIWTDDDYAEDILNDGDFTAEIDVTSYNGQAVQFIFQYKTSNVNQYQTDLGLDDVSVDLNEEVDLSVIARSAYLEIPRSQVDTTGGYDFEYWVINRGQMIPADAELTLSISSTDDPDFLDVFQEVSISAGDFTNDTLAATLNGIFNIPDNGTSYNYTFNITLTATDNNPTGDTNQSETVTIGDASTSILDDNIRNNLRGLVSLDDTEETVDVGDGIGTIIELVNPDYLGGFYVNFGTNNGETFSIKVIEIADRNATSGTLIAEIDDENGFDLNANTTDDDVRVLDDEDFDSYIYLDAGLYVIMVNPTDESDPLFEIDSSDPNDDRADFGDFVRGNEGNLYRGEDDDGDVDIRAFFSDYINYSVIANTEYEEIPRSQIDFTNGYDFEATIIKRGNSTPGELLLTATISSTDPDWVDVEFSNTIDAGVDFASEDTVTYVYNFDPFLPDDDANDTYTFDVTIEHVKGDGTDNNSAFADDNQNTTLRVGDATDNFNSDEDNSLGGFLGNDEDELSSGDFGDGMGEVFYLANADYLSAIFIDWEQGSGNEDISISIIRVTDPDATSGTVVATIDEDAANNPIEANDNSYIQVEDDPDFDNDIYLTSGYYVVMVNPIDDTDNDWAIAGSIPGDDKEDFGSYVRGNENNIYTDDEDDGNLDIRMYFRDNGAPEFFDPRGGSTGVDITTPVTSVTYNITEGVSESENIIVKDPQEFDTWTAELVNNNLTWLTFTATSAGFDISTDGTGTEGQYTAQVRAFDRLDTAFLNITINITENPAPEFTTSPKVLATEGLAYSYTATGEDELGEVVTASFELLPSWLSDAVVGDSITISGTPTASEVGIHAVKLLLTDASGNTAEQSFTVTVQANGAPEFQTFPPVKTRTEGDTYFYRVVATDEQGSSALSYNAGSIPAGFTFTDLGGGVGELTSASLPVGDSDVTLQVTDGITTTDQTFTVSVNAANTAPTFTSTPTDPDVVTANSTYTYNITATDADGDALQFKAVVLPRWAILINDGNGSARIIGDPNNPDAGDHSVTIEVSDGQASASQSYTIQVNASSVVDNGDIDDEEQAEVIGEDGNQDTDVTEARMFPNPADKVLKIREVEANVTVRIFNQAGRVVKSFNVTSAGIADIDVSDIQPGVYFVQMGDTAEVSRVIIE